MLSQTMLRIKRNIGTCLSEIDEIIEHCQGLLENNNIIILINGELYHKLEGECAKLTKVRHALFYIYSNFKCSSIFSSLRMLLLFFNNSNCFLAVLFSFTILSL